MKIAITGHRPEKLGDDHNLLRMNIAKALHKIGATYMYQGMAPGADLIAAKAARNIGLPFMAVVPWMGHVTTITPGWAYDYNKALYYADYVEILSDSETYTGPWLYHNRNHFMVDHADQVLAIWDGSDKGGTASTVKYAKKKGKPVNILDPVDMEFYIADY